MGRGHTVSLLCSGRAACRDHQACSSRAPGRSMKPDFSDVGCAAVHIRCGSLFLVVATMGRLDCMIGVSHGPIPIPSPSPSPSRPHANLPAILFRARLRQGLSLHPAGPASWNQEQLGSIASPRSCGEPMPGLARPGSNASQNLLAAHVPRSPCSLAGRRCSPALLLMDVPRPQQAVQSYPARACPDLR